MAWPGHSLGGQERGERRGRQLHMGGCGFSCFWSMVLKKHREERPHGRVPSDHRGFQTCGPARRTVNNGVWGKVLANGGQAPVEEARTNVTKEDQTDINGPKATPTDVALADVKAGLLAGSQSSVSAAGAASPSAKKANKPKECEEDDGINFFDSVSQVGALGLGGYKAHKGMLHQAAPSNLTEASSVPPSVAKKACDIHTVNLNALVARFLVDMRMFEWQPQSVEEYLAIGQLPQGLQLNGQATINGLALGFDNTGSVMDYDRESQIYTNATWSRHLVKATAVDYILDPFKNNCWPNSLWKNMLLCFFHAIIFHPSRTQLELASACEKGLRFVHEKLVGANLLQPQVVLGLRIAARWVKLVIEKEMAYGPCLAMWVCQRIKLIQKKRVMRSGMEITELLPEGDESANFYQHGNHYLHMIKTALLEANVWQGAGQRSLVREAPTTEAQEMAGCNKEIELSNCQLLQTCFERTSLLPGTAGCRLNLRKGTRPMFTLPGLLGGCRYVISNDPHVFLANGALGLSTVTDPTPKQSWWVAVDGMYYILMADIAAGGTMETVRWYKCGMNQDSVNPNNMDLAVPDGGVIY